MRILVVGAGAVGILFGSQLRQQGLDISHLVRPKRAAELAEKPFEVCLPEATFQLSPTCLTQRELTATATFDLIILTNKAYGLPQVIEDIAPAVGDNTLILPLLNGLRHLDLLDKAFGAERVLGGIAKTVATLKTPWQVRVATDYNSITVAARQPSQQAAVAEAVQLFQQSGLTVEQTDDIMGQMWDKFCRMAALGAVNCLLQGNVGEYMKSERGGEIALQIFDECCQVAAASGHALAKDSVQGFQRILTNPKSSFNSSMYRDMRNGLPIEGDHLVGDMVARGKDVGVATPMLEIAEAVLQVYSAG
ncbi:ketopantoate reductase family protein [Oceanospirillum linum]|uniref:2-dehydropantoate 2-reductase n=1 Tax=Oceanospirillum linum TaxID=966 RepID=A0A1T1H8M0_OCELI|nr:ketopantoate reductase family protein [Oceanospirillum linum]OOV86193.1 2-dehydropantoate 2-reductase [Oceanospirillum linum]SEG38493.1 ketopantoate reductase [Oleiphilus messinensis]SMP32070.1 ketopantoate reductase [Oceanospirillum linum]